MVYSYKGIPSNNTKNELMICNSKDESQKLFWAKERRHKRVFIWFILCNIQNQEKLIYKYRNQNWMIMGVETYWKEACENVWDYVHTPCNPLPFCVGRMETMMELLPLLSFITGQKWCYRLCILRSQLVDLEFTKSEITVVGRT